MGQDRDSFQRSAETEGQANIKGASTLNATGNIIKCGIGTGLLFMPYIFYQAGIILSIGFMALMGVLGFYSWAALCKVIRILEDRGLTYLGQTKLTLDTASGIVLGEKYRQFTIICTLIFIYGSSVGYVIFIIQTMDDYIPNQLITIGIVAVIYIPLSMFKQIEKLGFLSHLAIFALSSAIAAVLGYSSYKISTGDYDGFSANLSEISNLPLYFGVFAFAYDINGVVTEVHASMEKKRSFTKVLFYYTLFSFILGSTLGVLGYLAFQSDVNSVIFKNFTGIGALSPIISSFYSFSLIPNVLLNGFPIVKEVDRLVLKSKQNIPVMLIIRVIFFASICILGVFVSSITNVFNLLGCIFSVLLTFVVPMGLVEKLKYLDRKNIQLKSVVAVKVEDNEETPILGNNQESLQSTKSVSNLPSKNEDEEKFPQGLGYSIANALVVLIGIVGGVSGLISSIIDLTS